MRRLCWICIATFIVAFCAPWSVVAAPCITQARLGQVLTAVNSPMASTQATLDSFLLSLFNTAWVRDVDPRLIVAVAGAESSYGTLACGTGSNNAWGIMHCTACRPDGTQCVCTCRGYSTWGDGAAHAAQILANYRNNLGLRTIEQLGTRYCDIAAGGCGVAAPTAGCGPVRPGDTAWTYNVRCIYEGLGGDSANWRYLSINALGKCCFGDCNDDNIVTVDELILSIDVILGKQHEAMCPAIFFPLPPLGDGSAEVTGAIRAVSYALGGCPPYP